MSQDTFVCSVCSKTEGYLLKFPKDLCLKCYAKTPEANAPITARQLSQMWGGK